MPLYRPRDLQQFLSVIGRKPNRRMSQNFLIDGNIARKIVKLADPQPYDMIIEVGPGPGVLTELFMSDATSHIADSSMLPSIVAIEKDTDFADSLRRIYDITQYKGYTKILCQDVLSCNLQDLLVANAFVYPNLCAYRAKLVSNLPYHISKEFIHYIIRFWSCLSHVVLMVQYEFGKKLLLQPGDEKFSFLAFILQYYTHIQWQGSVSKNCFLPSPQVESCIVSLQIKSNRLIASSVDEELQFLTMVHCMFSMKRKTVVYSLKKYVYSLALIHSALDSAQIPHTSRPQEIPIESLAALFKYLISNKINFPLFSI